MNGISTFNTKQLNFDVIDLGKQTMLFTSNVNHQFTCKIDKPLRGGKSGDTVLLVSFLNDSKQFILKIFSEGDLEKTEKDDRELKYHLQFMSIFSNTKGYVPCPQIHLYGRLTGSIITGTTSALKYIIMEALTPPYELDTYLRDMCTNSEFMDPKFKTEIKSQFKTQSKAILDFKIHDIMIQLFFIICKLQFSSLTHCDLHTKNIMIVPNKSKIVLDFSEIFPDGEKWNVGTHIVKVIDFGEGSNSVCRKHRTTSGALTELKKHCSGSMKTLPDMISLVWGEVKKSVNSQVDINFYCRILEIVKLFDEHFQYLNMELIWEQSSKIFNIESTNKFKQAKGLDRSRLTICLKNIYYELMKLI